MQWKVIQMFLNNLLLSKCILLSHVYFHCLPCRVDNIQYCGVPHVHTSNHRTADYLKQKHDWLLFQTNTDMSDCNNIQGMWERGYGDTSWQKTNVHLLTPLVYASMHPRVGGVALLDGEMALVCYV